MAITLTIGGNTYPLLAKTLKITDKLRRPSQLTCKIRYTSGDEPDRGAEITVNQDATRIFTGVVIRPTRIDETHGNRILFDILAEDYQRNMRRDVIAKAWSNRTLKTILEEVVDKTPGVTLHPSQDDGPALDRIRSNYLGLHELVRALADVSERFYFVDEQKRLRVHEIGDVDAPEALTTANAIHIGRVFYDVDDSEYVNRVRVVGDLRPGNQRVETFEGDGVTRAWNLDFEPVETPVISVGGVEQDASLTDGTSPWRAGPFISTVEQRSSQSVLSGARLYVVEARTAGARLWEIDDQDTPGAATLKGTFPSGLSLARGLTFHEGCLYLTDDTGDELWELKDLDDPSSATNKGSLPGTVTTPRAAASHGGNIYIAEGAELWEITDVDDPGDATLKGRFPSGLTSPNGMASHNGNLYVALLGGELWEITDVDNPGGATNKGEFPNAIDNPQGMTSHNGNLYIIQGGVPDELWELTDVDNPGDATEVGNVPSGLSQPAGISSGGADTVTVTYNPLEPVIATAQDQDEIDANGLYSRTFPGGNVTQAAAQEAARVHLRRYSHLIHHIAFRTRTLGWRTGQELTVALTTPAVSGTFVIDHVELRDMDGVTIFSEIKASDAEGDDDWTELWADSSTADVVSNQPVYDADGNKLGDEAGVSVSISLPGGLGRVGDTVDFEFSWGVTGRNVDEVTVTAGDGAEILTTTGDTAAQSGSGSGTALLTAEGTATVRIALTDSLDETIDFDFDTMTVLAPQFRNDYRYRRATTIPDTPTGGNLEELHRPLGWTTGQLSPTQTESVWLIEREAEYFNDVFVRAGDWEAPTEWMMETGVPTPPDPPPPTDDSVPNRPANLTLTFANNALGASWDPPTDTGGGPITGYEYHRFYLRPGFLSLRIPTTGNEETTNTTRPVAGNLETGTVVTFRVRARNEHGASQYRSASYTFT